MYKKNMYKVAIAIAVVLALLLPVSAAFDNDEETYLNSLNAVVEENVISYEKYRDLGRDGDIIIDEDFESWIPSRWHTIQTTDETNSEYPCYWHQMERFGNSLGAGLWWGYDHQDEWLITPSLNLSVWTDVNMSFWTYVYGRAEGRWEADYIKVSSNGGETWEILGDLHEMAPPHPGGFFGEIIEFNLSDYAGLPEVVVAFHRLTGDVNMNVGVWKIDDVVITGYGRSTVDVQEVSGGFGVSAIIGNVGNGVDTDVEWSINITGGLLGLIDKQVSGTIPILAAGDSETIKSGIFLGLGPISITVTAGCAEETVDGKQFIIFTKVG